MRVPLHITTVVFCEESAAIDRLEIGIGIGISYRFQHILHTCHQKQLRKAMVLWTLSWVRGGPSFPCKQRRPPMERKSIQAW